MLPATTSFAADLTWASKSVVKLFVTQQSWKVSQPWSKSRARQSTCTGFFIKQGILTNAHCIADATYIEVEVPGVADKIETKLIAVNHQIDLALLSPLNDSRISNISFIEFDDLPDLREKVVTVGYPNGGRQVSYTEGVVSRIDVMRYVHSNISAPLVQTDASINSGNSGGPVFSDKTGSCLGVATQKLSSGEGLGYFIPTTIIRQFLLDIEDSNVNGIPSLGVFFQTLENPAARAQLKLTKSQSGIRIRNITKSGTLDQILKENDVLLKIDGKTILNDGRVPFQENGRIWLSYHVATKQVGDKLKLSYARDGKIHNIEVVLKPFRLTLIPRQPQYDQQPNYYVAGGLLFIAVEPRYLWNWGPNWSKNIPTSLKAHESTIYGHQDLEQLVVISEVFDASVNKGYSGEIENIRVKNINGKNVLRLSDVVNAFETNTDDFHIIELESNINIVLNRQQANTDNVEIRKRYDIQKNVD
ncbi:MAG: serine protease [Gammaproteobacteria bacterium]|nr:serine protease [Gammaproteobacteria bacterium]